MVLRIADLVKETSASTSTTPFALLGAMTGHITFSAIPGISVGDTVYYTIRGVDGTGMPTAEWECGLGTYSAANTLTRTTVLSSSNSGSPVNFSVGTKQVYLTMPAAQVSWIREKLTANRTYYVRTDGSDSNTGLANTSGGAFLTIQKAVDVVMMGLDIGGRAVTIQIADGTYTTPTNLFGAVIGIGYTGSVTIQGNSSTPANVVLSTTSAHCFNINNGCLGVTLKDLKIQTTTSGIGIVCQNRARLNISNIVFGATVSAHMFISDFAAVVATGDYSIVGAAPVHAQCGNGGYFQVASRTITITGSPAFSTAFIYLQGISNASFMSNTFSGSSTGPQYNVSQNSVLQASGTTIPGSAGSTASGGIVV